MYCSISTLEFMTFHNLSITYVLSFSIIECTKFLCGRKKMAQSCHIPRKKKLKSPYVDHRFLNVRRYHMSCMGFKKKSAFSLTSSQIWLSKSSCGGSPVHLPHKIARRIPLLLCVPLSYPSFKG